MKLIMEERGNGFPDCGDLLAHWDDGGNQRVWKITHLGRVRTGGSGWGNTLEAVGDELDDEDIQAAEAEGWNPDDQTVSVQLVEDEDEDEDTITVTASDDGSSEEITCERGDDYEALARGLFADADYGNGDYRVTISWEATDAAGDEVEAGTFVMTGETEEPPCPEADEHDWTSEGEGGCAENPGVWSTGGTGLTFRSHCRACGLKRVEHHTGAQRNPGECDTTTYGDSDD